MTVAHYSQPERLLVYQQVSSATLEFQRDSCSSLIEFACTALLDGL